MRAFWLFIGVIVAGCARQENAVAPVAGERSPVEEAAIPDEDKTTGIIQPWTVEQQERLLNERLPGGMEGTMGQFANMFLVMSRIHLGCGVGLVTSSSEISQSPLQSPFPASYQPTLRELLDTIALQTSSQWKYDPSSKYFSSDIKGQAPVRDLAMFEFTKTEREKPYEVALVKGWKAADRGHWMMLSPPGFPVGMDIYEMGTYSSDDEVDASEFQQRMRGEIALDWARRVKEDAGPEDLKPVRVGELDALYFESLAPSQLGKDIRWRQWVMMADNRCYFIMSTILPDLEEQILPDVEKMVASFRTRPM
jgi:hypothetical protein